MNFKSILIIFIIFNLISCRDNAPKKIIHPPVKKSVTKLKKMEFHIKGMTCEIGCARLIASKLAKTKGIISSKVSFKDSLGMVEYDTNQLSQKDIINVVEQIADGNLYKVGEQKTVRIFSIKK